MNNANAKKRQGTRSRPGVQKIASDEDSFGGDEDGESEQSESNDGKVDLNGKLNLVYDRVMT